MLLPGTIAWHDDTCIKFNTIYDHSDDKLSKWWVHICAWHIHWSAGQTHAEATCTGQNYTIAFHVFSHVSTCRFCSSVSVNMSQRSLLCIKSCVQDFSSSSLDIGHIIYGHFTNPDFRVVYYEIAVQMLVLYVFNHGRISCFSLLIHHSNQNPYCFSIFKTNMERCMRTTWLQVGGETE